MTKYTQGKFTPKNPKKYKGDPTQIFYRSSWELTVLRKLDEHPDVIEWSSEEIIVPYISPIDMRAHRYFPDFVVKKRNHSDGKIETVMIEIKPKKQTQPPKIQNKKTKTYLNEVATWGINSAKWKAADTFCKKKGWKFIIMTENEIYGKS